MIFINFSKILFHEPLFESEKTCGYLQQMSILYLLAFDVPLGMFEIEQQTWKENSSP